MWGVGIYDLAVALARNHEVHVVYPSHVEATEAWNDTLFRHEIPYPFKIHPLAQVHGCDLVNLVPLLLNMGMGIVRVKRSYDIDLIHAFWSIPAGFVSALCCGKTPLITSLMGSDLKVFSRGSSARIRRTLVLPIVKYPYHKSTKLIAISQDLKREAIELGAKDENIHVISDGIDIRKFRPMDKGALRRNLNLPEGLLLIYVGSVFRLKRIDRLIRTSARLSKDFDLHVLIVGDGPERRSMETLAKELHVQDRVIFTGQILQDEVPQLTAASDVFVLCSETEGLPRVVREAMACGVPVVASNIGGLPEIVSNGETGYLFNDDIELERELRQIMSYPELRERMGAKALEFARKNFTVEKAVKEYEDLYSSLEPAVRRQIPK
jgi:N-acetyl-alpha-D-glucosaminyl L-malate synthase BshA